MFKRFLLLVVSIPTLLGFTSKLIACQWDLTPNVLIVTSYENAHEQSLEDQIIYQKLQKIYGEHLVTTIFSEIDDNVYASIFNNLISRFNLKKIFILDPKFLDYLPNTSDIEMPSSNLIRIIQQFANVDFYFFNNQISNNIKKISNNIYEFRFDTPTKAETAPETYGAAVAKHFFDTITNDKGDINTDEYNFDVDLTDSKFVVKVGILNNIGSTYQQKVINDFLASLEKNVPNNSKYEYYQLNLEISNVYTGDNVKIVEEGAKQLYRSNHVNFILNTNDWYNNAIAHATSSAEQSKTAKFIANSVVNKDDYKYQGGSYLLFTYNLDLSILDYTVDNSFPENLQVLDDAPERTNAYGLNNKLIFVDGN